MTVTAELTVAAGGISPAAAILRDLCGGAVSLPGDPGYDAARQPWNVAVDQRPAAVAYPADAGEAAAVVRAHNGGDELVPTVRLDGDRWFSNPRFRDLRAAMSG